jgi:hypothetical protein
MFRNARMQYNEIDYYIGSELRHDTVKAYLEHNFAYHSSWKWPAFVLSLVSSIALRFLVAISTKYINFQKR